MQYDSHLHKPLKDFTLLSFESGLTVSWIRQSTAQSKKLGFLKYETYDISSWTDFRPLKIADMTIIFKLSAYASLLSVLVFVMELVLYKFKQH